MKTRHFLNMYSYIRKLEKLFKNDIYVTVSLQTVKNYMGELFITADIESLSETEFFDRWSSETPVNRRIMRAQSFESLVKEKGVVIIDDELRDFIAEGATQTLKILYEATKPDT